jgi:streptogramin lyase
MKRKSFVCFVTIILAGVSLFAATLQAGLRSKNADLVLGQYDYTHNTTGITGSTFNGVYGIAIDTTTGRVYTSEGNNNRILWWNNIESLTNGSAADGVLGQTLFTTNASATTQTGLNYPQGICVDGSGNLYVADRNNSRVLKYTAPSTNGQTAAVVVGQTNFTANSFACTQVGMCEPFGVTVDPSGSLWVADASGGASRVTKYMCPISSGQAAHVVLGQPTFTTASAAHGQTGLAYPNAVTSDSSGNIWVVDNNNSRILKYSAPVSTFQAACIEIGQVDYTTMDIRQGATGSREPRLVSGFAKNQGS